jgi:hypothetical protein
VSRLSAYAKADVWEPDTQVFYAHARVGGTPAFAWTAIASTQAPHTLAADETQHFVAAEAGRLLPLVAGVRRAPQSRSRPYARAAPRIRQSRVL